MVSMKDSHQRIHTVCCHLQEVREQIEVRTMVSSGVGELVGRGKEALSTVKGMFCLLTGCQFDGYTFFKTC